MSIFDALGGGSIVGGATSLIGAAVSAYDTSQAVNYANQVAGFQTQQANLSAKNFQLEEQVNNQRQTQMNLNASRQQMNYLRQQQMAQHAGIANAAAGGALFGSALPGELAGAAGTSGRNILASSQNLQIGTNIFGLENQQSANKMQIATLGGEEATAQGQANIWKGYASEDQSIGNSIGNFLKLV